MRTQVSWSLALVALVMSGSLTTGCKSSKGGRESVDGGPQDGAVDGGDGSLNSEGGAFGFNLSRSSGLQTDEAGKTDTFTVSLSSRPTADVTISVTSSDETEGKVAPAQLVFTPVDWASPHTVTVTGQNDDDGDGSQEYKVLLGLATSTDPNYANKAPGEVTVTNLDNETAGVTATGTEGLSTFEVAGVPATYQLKLNTKPTGDVLITLTSQDTGEVTVDPGTYTFTTDNWNAPQTVTLKGVDDPDVDGPQTVLIKGAVTSTADERYNGVAIADVTVVNRDDETATVIVEPTTGLRTFEDGRSRDQFVVFLNTKPTANVVIGLTSNTPTEALPSVDKLTFTPDNWNAPQTVYVAGVDDQVPDQDQTFTIVTALAVSPDTRFATADGPDVTGLNIDDESANVVIDDEQLFATEGQDPASFSIALTTAPTADVTIPLSSLTSAQATVAPASVTFTASNWNAKQLVVVTAVNDPIADGSQTVVIDLAAATSTDVRYAGLDAANVSVSVVDNDSPGFDVTPTKLTTNESGETGSFAVQLLSRPTQTVTLPVVSKKTTEVTVDKTNLVFTVDDWNSPHVVTLKGVEDNLIDGNPLVEITVGPAVSGDAGYAGKTIPPLFVTNVDNDAAGLSLELPAGGLRTDEDGTTAEFSVALLKPPSADVTFTLTLSKPTEASSDTATLTFTKDDWAGKQKVVLTGLDDNSVSDGDQDYEVIFAAAVSDDTNYVGYVPPRIPAKNIDNDSPGISPSVTGGLTTYENQTLPTAQFEIKLRSRPDAGKTVEVTIASDNPAEGIATPATWTFDEDNWNSPKQITVRGVQDDKVADGNRAYNVLVTSTSNDLKYAGLQAGVALLNVDDDSAGYVFTGVPSSGALIVGEDGAISAKQFSVSLTSKPTQNVRLQVRSTDEGEGKADKTVLDFTPTDWDSLHTVTVTGQGDLTQDGRQPFFIEFSAVEGAPEYAAIPAPDRVAFQNRDTDSAGLELVDADLVTSEDGETGFLKFSVEGAPNSPVTITLTASKSSNGNNSPEGAFDALGSQFTTTMTFTSLVTEQTVDLYGVNDDFADNNQDYKISFAPAVSDDPSYAGRVIPTITARNNDNDTPGILVTGVSSPFTTSEDLTTYGEFTVALRTQPVGTVRVPITLSRPDDVVVQGGAQYIDFDENNWEFGVPVRVNGVPELVADGDKQFTVGIGPVTSAPSDTNYVGLSGTAIDGTALDNDIAGVRVQVTTSYMPVSQLRTGETLASPTSATFTVKLSSRPTADVKVNITSTNELEGKVDIGTLTFTPALSGTGSFDVEQTVTVTGINDDLDDGTKSYAIVISKPVSDDATYANLSEQTLSAENFDDDDASFVAERSLPFFTKESTSNNTLTVRLTSEPKFPVTIAVTSLNTNEIAVSPDALVFDASNWRAGLVVDVVSVNDDIADGDRPVNILLAKPVSQDLDYEARPSQLIPVVNRDEDTAGFLYGAWSGAANNVVTYETTTTDSFSVRLQSQPLNDVTLPIRIGLGSDEASVTSSLVFTAANWRDPQTVTVTSKNDGIIDHLPNGTKPYQVVFDAPVTTDNTYAALTPPVVAGTSWEAPRSCLELLNTTTANPGSSTYWLDTDVQGPAVPFRGYCDMVTGATNGTSSLVGGWTLLSWTQDSEETGAPYPGDIRPSNNAPNLLVIPAGSGVPAESVNALFDSSTQLGQGQTVTITGLGGFSAMQTFKPLKDYEYAGVFTYGPLTDLVVTGGDVSGCAGAATGVYATIADRDADPTTVNNGVAVYLNQNLVVANDAALSDYGTDGSYRWSIGNRTGYCATNGTPPASIVGTWQDEQYGPKQQSAAGAYSIWVR